MEQRRGPRPAVVRRPNAARRDNAPINKRRPATTVPDIMFAIAAALLTMAVVFLFASFANKDVTAGDAGRYLARIFAAALAVSGLFTAALGVALLRDDRQVADHYTIPISLGVIAGAAESYLFLLPAGNWLWAPLLLLVFAFRPLRRFVARRLGRG